MKIENALVFLRWPGRDPASGPACLVTKAIGKLVTAAFVGVPFLFCRRLADAGCALACAELEALRVAAAAARPIGSGVALEPPHLDLSVAHHYHELAEAGAHLIGLTRLEPSQVEPISMSVVRQRRYSNSQPNPGV
jgi:hypothetical protein